MSRREGLDKYVRRILKEKGFSFSDVQRRSGGGISDSYICSIVNGKVGELTVGKLSALAHGLGVPEEEIICVALGASGKSGNGFQKSEFATLFYRYKELSDEDKKEVRMLLEIIDREIEWRRARNKSNHIS